MSWAKIDDQLHSNEKALECSLAARGLWVTCLSWVADKETDGAVPKSIVKLHAGPQWQDLTEELVRAGLWDEGDTGWAFHDYLEYNPSREDLEKERRATAERKAAWKARRQQENGGGNAVPPAGGNTVPPGVPHNEGTPFPHMGVTPFPHTSGTRSERRSSGVPPTVPPTVRNGEGTGGGTVHPDPDPDPDIDRLTDIRARGEEGGRSSVVDSSLGGDASSLGGNESPLGGTLGGELETLKSQTKGLKGLAFVQAVIEAKPSWGKALADAYLVAEEQSRTKTGKPIHNPLRWRVQVLTNWLSGDGTPDELPALANEEHQQAEQERLKSEQERINRETEEKMREVELGRAQIRERLAREKQAQASDTEAQEKGRE